MKTYVIKGINGTYLRFFAPIGPCFGGTRDDAMLFATRREALRAMGRHAFAFIGAIVESAPTKVNKP